MIETSVRQILEGRMASEGFIIYAVFDQHGGCIYVGYSKDLKARMRGHLRDKSEWQEYLADNDDLLVRVYDHDDVDNIALSQEPEASLVVFSDEQEWAKAAEWYMCEVLRPYINRRKTYKPEIDMAIRLAKYGELSRQTAYEAALGVLRKWNVMPKRFAEEEEIIRRKLRLDTQSDQGETY